MPRVLRPSLLVAALAALLVLVLVPMQGYGAARTSSATTLRTWSYVGPGADLSGARVVLRDRDGRVLASGRTTRGTYTFTLRSRAGLKFPLSVSTSGGTAAGTAFSGSLSARVFDIGPRYAVVQNSLISTAASRMPGSHTRRGYAQAVSRVRRALGIQKGSLPGVLRLRNSDVGYAQLMRAAARARGFDALADVVAYRAVRGERVRGLRPRSAEASYAPARRPGLGARAANQATAPSTTQCSPATPTSGSTSSTTIADIATIGVGGLMEYAGLPTTSTEGLTGMLLAPIGLSGSTVAQADVTAVLSALGCLSAQVNYLSAQVAQVQLSLDIASAQSCSSAITGTNGYPGYEYLVQNAGQYPINSSNTSLTGQYLPAWQDVVDTCGAAINNMLFGTAGGQRGAWQQLNANTQSGVQWYTQEQAQDLQTFLSYWGTLLYQQFILSNEYQNYYGYFEAAQGAAGATTLSNGTTVCDSGSTTTTSTYCVWQSNIGAAYPGDLYSDEIGILSSGLGVNASPGGMVAPLPIASTSPQYFLRDTSTGANQSYSPTAMNMAWWYNYYLNFTGYNPSKGGSNELKFLATGGQPWCIVSAVGNCPPSGISLASWSQASADAFNAQGVNPKGYGSAVQTYWNPQAVGRTPVTSSQISALKSTGPGGQSATQVLYDAINQTPSSAQSPAPAPAWSSISPSQVAYWTADESSWIQIWAEVSFYFGIEISVSAPLGSTSGAAPNNKNNENQNDLAQTPVFAMLSGRTWWPGAAQAASYVPPAPPVP